MPTISHTTAIQFRQMNTMLKYVHMGDGFFLPRVEEGGRRLCGEG